MGLARVKGKSSLVLKLRKAIMEEPCLQRKGGRDELSSSSEGPRVLQKGLLCSEAPLLGTFTEALKKTAKLRLGRDHISLVRNHAAQALTSPGGPSAGPAAGA